MKVITESGSVYEIWDGWYSKNGEPRQKKWYAYCFESWEGMTYDDIPEPYPFDNEDKRLPIQVGKKMKIGNKNDWWVSTKIISIEEN